MEKSPIQNPTAATATSLAKAILRELQQRRTGLILVTHDCIRTPENGVTDDAATFVELMRSSPIPVKLLSEAKAVPEVLLELEVIFGRNQQVFDQDSNIHLKRNPDTTFTDFIISVYTYCLSLCVCVCVSVCVSLLESL